MFISKTLLQLTRGSLLETLQTLHLNITSTNGNEKNLTQQQLLV